MNKKIEQRGSVLRAWVGPGWGRRGNLCCTLQVKARLEISRSKHRLSRMPEVLMYKQCRRSAGQNLFSVSRLYF